MFVCVRVLKLASVYVCFFHLFITFTIAENERINMYTLYKRHPAELEHHSLCCAFFFGFPFYENVAFFVGSFLFFPPHSHSRILHQINEYMNVFTCGVLKENPILFVSSVGKREKDK